jgi:uncharacterized protein with HEPN domain
MNERDHAYLRDMLDAAREAMGFVRGLDSGALETDRKLALALVQEMAIIGEAAGRISPEVARSAPGIPWPKIVGMRNRLIHGYREVDLEVVWKAVTEDLPSPVAELERLLNAT